jgi:hypothetical protein
MNTKIKVSSKLNDPEFIHKIQYNTLNIVFILYLISIIWIFLEQLLFKRYGYESWQISEFMINYQAGFVRRGLLGEIFFMIVKTFNVDFENLIKFFCAVCVVIVSLFFIIKFKTKNYSMYILLLCFFLTGNIIWEWWIRKDYLFIIILIIIISVFKNNKIHFTQRYLIINIFLSFIILSHEVFAFISFPILLILTYKAISVKNYRMPVATAILYLLPSITSFFLVIFSKGNESISATIWDSWIPHISNDLISIGHAVDALSWSTTHTFLWHFRYNVFYEDQEVISILVWLILFPIIYYLATNILLTFKKDESSITENDKNRLSNIIIFQFFSLLPVFAFLSVDYVRVIFYWIVSSFVIFLLVPTGTLDNLFPLIFKQKVKLLNAFLTSIVRPTKTVLFILMLIIGIPPINCDLEAIYKSSVIYHVLWLLSKPLILIKDILISSFNT